MCLQLDVGECNCGGVILTLLETAKGGQNIAMEPQARTV